MYNKLMIVTFLGAFSLMSGAHAAGPVADGQSGKGLYQCYSPDPATAAAKTALLKVCAQNAKCRERTNLQEKKQCFLECREKTGCILQRPVK